ncbi:hypothetical protein, partial [Xanthomonas citri]
VQTFPSSFMEEITRKRNGACCRSDATRRGRCCDSGVADSTEQRLRAQKASEPDAVPTKRHCAAVSSLQWRAQN